MSRRRLEITELRKVLDYLYDGEPGTSMILLQCRNFKQEHDVYLWLRRNQIKGKKLIEFFQNEANSVDGLGYINGINKIIRMIEKDKFKILKSSDLK